MDKLLAWLSKPRQNTIDVANILFFATLFVAGESWIWLLGGWIPLEILSIHLERKYHGTLNGTPTKGTPK